MRRFSSLFISILVGFVILTPFIFGCPFHSAAEQKVDESVHRKLEPIVRIIVIPDQYDDQVVATIGYLVFSDEEHMLYASREDGQHGISTNGIEFDLPRDSAHTARLTMLTGKYVMVVGTFKAPRPGSQLLPAGRLVDLVGVEDESTWGRYEIRFKDMIPK